MFGLTICIGFLIIIVAGADYPCGKPKIQHQATIRGGTSTKHGQWPWHAAIYHKDGRSLTYACGGTLLSKEFVITAAHCLFNENTFQLLNRKRISVRLGIHNLEEMNSVTTKEFPVHEMYMFSNFSRDNLRNDIAVLELGEVVRFNDYILPACLNVDPVMSSWNGTAIGWGMIENDELSPELRQAELPMIDPVNCLISDRDYFGHTIDHGMFCAGHQNGTTVCNGDSGGGLFVKREDRWYLSGIVSFIKKRPDHTNFCSTDSYAGFTDVSKYISWIKNETNIQVQAKSTSSCGRRKLTDLEASWPWRAAIYSREPSSDTFRCSGTIVSKKIIVTAAQCTAYTDSINGSRMLTVKVGIPYALIGGQEFIQAHEVLRIFVPNKTTTNGLRQDIALLQLQSKIIYSDYIQPICLWRVSVPFSSTFDRLGHLPSWNLDKNHIPISFNEVHFQTLSHNYCYAHEYIRKTGLVDEQSFCAEIVFGKTGIGNSGAGLYYLDPDTNQWMLRGILSAGSLDPESFKLDNSIPLVFTDAAFYLTADQKNGATFKFEKIETYESKIKTKT
ncbi:polyserase-2-like [Uranotaenia lowii]|uniref:polyserase-2-like n=1 Tax=Uranotaenia lowii TaxID=190385 RepID=UPI0024790584|nr:polyserase-2-like [Uranotaenia lowii]